METRPVLEQASPKQEFLDEIPVFLLFLPGCWRTFGSTEIEVSERLYMLKFLLTILKSR
ncbi:hypothetical protein Holit_02393 [Hollandina sp. SP2]